MAITVERRLHLDLNGATHVLTEEEARTLVAALLDGLGGLTGALGTDIYTASTLPPVAPVAIESGPVAGRVEMASAAVPSAKRAQTIWTQGMDDRLRALAAQGMKSESIARELSVGPVAVKNRAHKLGITTGGGRGSHLRTQPVATEPPVVSLPPAPPPPTPEPEPNREPVTNWTPAQTKALIREMSTNGGNLRTAAERTGHTVSQCFNRWKHLKDAGTMRIEDYLKSQEATA